MMQAGYICRNCVGLIEKYQQLHKILSNNLSKAVPYLPKLPIAAGMDNQSGQSTPSRSTHTEGVSQSLSMTVGNPSISTEVSSQSRSPALDYHLWKERFIIHVLRIISTYLDFFKEDFINLVHRHIPHRYSSEMCRKSEIVSTYYLLLIPLFII